ncbi:sulfotransferase domain-containing protein [Stratiformator vulcanicus]|uniref:Sulfotransferase domain protein n=1 Tax=Stratiformator vulcanicus TaxID=2527980 RepID=A0A517R621_9PLAN|nr:sulfotransferase domain-containing protein [Stratiformator vulcanicus]QDT39309.1 Sulfotransferase domain protein [Stratiformator vulcanicus]
MASARRWKGWLKSVPAVERIVEYRRIRHGLTTERALLEGTHKTTCQHPSILFFSFNKAATQYVESILKQCSKRSGLTPVNFEKLSFNTDFPYLGDLSAEAMAPYQQLFRPQGYLYCPFSKMVEGIPDLDSYQIVLMTRDPRDLLVSLYFSVAFSHSLPPRDSVLYPYFCQMRQRSQEMSVDEFALEMCDHIGDKFRRYRDALCGKEAVHLTSYELMTSDFPHWLTGLLEHCELDVSESTLARIVSAHHKSRPATEQADQHVRKGRPGDHQEKLSEATIAELNERLGDVLSEFGYC